MDFQAILKDYKCKACIMSVDIYEDGKYGNIRVAAGNKAHAEEIERITGHPFVDDTPYEMSFTKDNNFEDFVYRGAVRHEQLHTYVELYQMGLWLELFLLPLETDVENKGYCVYIYDAHAKANTEKMSDLSPEISSSVLSACIKLRGANDFKQRMYDVIQDIRDMCDARRCCILLLDKTTHDCGILSDAIRPGEVVPPKRQSMDRSFYDIACTWEDTLAGSTCIMIKSKDDLESIKERNPVWYESLQKGVIDSLALFPLRHNDELVGYIWISNFKIETAVRIKEILEITSFFIASEISNYQLLKRLQILSNMDLLTGCQNRNAMNNRVSDFDPPEKINPKSIGVIFADINGLKKVNDVEGHEAGDKLLKRAAYVLETVFDTYEVYRAGGDEFMILAIDTTEEDIVERLGRLPKVSEENNVSFAFGYAFDDHNIDIRREMHQADERMYDNKQEYYKKYPERKYR